MNARFETVLCLTLAAAIGAAIARAAVHADDIRTFMGILRIHPGVVFAKSGNGEGGATGWFYYGGKSSGVAGVIGVYPEVPENPLIGLSPIGSTGEVVRALVRLAGGNHSGVIVLKTHAHGDGLVLGLGLDDPNEMPYISCSKPCKLFDR